MKHKLCTHLFRGRPNVHSLCSFADVFAMRAFKQYTYFEPENLEEAQECMIETAIAAHVPKRSHRR